jgi:hypothetical protein
MTVPMVESTEMLQKREGIPVFRDFTIQNITITSKMFAKSQATKWFGEISKERYSRVFRKGPGNKMHLESL